MLGRVLAAQIAGRPQHLILHVTNRCTYRCPTCFVDQSDPCDLPVELAERTLLELGRLFWCDIGGGEPTLHHDLVRVCAAVESSVLAVPTNASDPERVEALAREIRAAVPQDLIFLVSVDGLQETNDRIRGPGSYDRVWEAVERLKGVNGVFVKLSTILCDDNVDEIIPCMEDVYTHRPDFHSIVLLRGEARDPAFGLPPLERVRELLPQILKIQKRYSYGQSRLRRGVLRNFHRILWRYSLQTLETRTQATTCYAGRSHLVIWPNGDVAPCELLPPVGNLYDTSLREILTSPSKRDRVAAIRAGQCACTHNCALLASIFLNPKRHPSLVTGLGTRP